MVEPASLSIPAAAWICAGLDVFKTAGLGCLQFASQQQAAAGEQILGAR
jgi:hypothetical protein